MQQLQMVAGDDGQRRTARGVVQLLESLQRPWRGLARLRRRATVKRQQIRWKRQWPDQKL